PSSIGSSAGPTPRIWKKWSITQSESIPAASAVSTTRPRVGPISGVPPGHLNASICNPNFIARLLVALGVLGEEVHRTGHEDVLDRALAAPELGAADERDGSSVDLAERELGRGGELVGHGANGRAHDAAVVVRAAAEVLERLEARDADRDVD